MPFASYERGKASAKPTTTATTTMAAARAANA